MITKCVKHLSLHINNKYYIYILYLSSPNMVRYIQKVPIGSSCVRPSVSAVAGRDCGANSWVIILSWTGWEGRRGGQWLFRFSEGGDKRGQDVVLLPSWLWLDQSVRYREWRNWNRKIFILLTGGALDLVLYCSDWTVIINNRIFVN